MAERRSKSHREISLPNPPLLALPGLVRKGSSRELRQGLVPTRLLRMPADLSPTLTNIIYLKRNGNVVRPYQIVALAIRISVLVISVRRLSVQCLLKFRPLTGRGVHIGTIY